MDSCSLFIDLEKARNLQVPKVVSIRSMLCLQDFMCYNFPE